MNRGLRSKLDDLFLNELWVIRHIVDAAFVETQHARLSQSEPEHIRLKFYAKFFEDRQISKLSDDDVRTYLDLLDFEHDLALKSWAIGFLIECDIISRIQLIGLRQDARLGSQHHVFLDREIKARIVES